MRIRWNVLFLVFAIAGSGPRAASAADPVPPHETLTIDSKALGETRRINVYVPTGYESAAGIRYPVLYMPDGGIEEDLMAAITTRLEREHPGTNVDSHLEKGLELRSQIAVGVRPPEDVANR